MIKLISVFTVIIILLITGCGRKEQFVPLNKQEIKIPPKERLCWEPVGEAGITKGAVNYISLYVDNNVPYISFQNNDYSKLNVMRYRNNQWEHLKSEGFKQEAIYYPSCLVLKETCYATYKDINNGDIIKIRKYTENSWEELPNKSQELKNAELPRLVTDGNELYIAFRDRKYSNTGLTVMKYTGETWAYVGKPGFINSNAYHFSVDVDSGVPYIAFVDTELDGKITVMKYEENEWKLLGNRGFSVGIANYVTIKVNNGIPYVAFSDSKNQGRGILMKYKDDRWIVIGNSVFSDQQVNFLSLFIYKEIPYIAFSDGVYLYRTTVLKYEDESFQIVGSPGFSDSGVGYVNLFIENGTAYVAYSDGALNGKITVMSCSSL